jgi:ATP phosphoribosyltransferase
LVSNPNSKHGDLIAKLDKRINGYQTAKDYVMLTYNVNKEFLDQAKTITPGLSSPTVMVLAPQEDGSEWVSVTAMTKKKVVAEAMDQLEEIGATGIAVMPIENCRQ